MNSTAIPDPDVAAASRLLDLMVLGYCCDVDPTQNEVTSLWDVAVTENNDRGCAIDVLSFTTEAAALAAIDATLPRSLPLSPTTRRIIEAAASVYPDGLVANVLDTSTGKLLPEQPGDGLATFIAVEIAEAARDEMPLAAVQTAIAALERAETELAAVVARLRMLEDTISEETIP